MFSRARRWLAMHTSHARMRAAMIARSQKKMHASALTALEMLVAVLQAYVFAVLTCIYLHDALHPGH